MTREMNSIAPRIVPIQRNLKRLHEGSLLNSYIVIQHKVLTKCHLIINNSLLFLGFRLDLLLSFLILLQLLRLTLHLHEGAIEVEEG